MTKRAIDQRRQRLERRQAGLCAYPGCGLASPGRALCAEHGERARQRKRALYWAAKTSGVCTHQGCKAPPCDTALMCLQHRQVATRNTTTSRERLRCRPVMVGEIE